MVLGGLCGFVAPLGAQNPLPPPAQAQAALQSALQENPQLADEIRQRIQESGLSADQIRARLSASGYPASLLDAYLGSQAKGAAVTPGSDELAAVQALGLGAFNNRGQLLPIDTGFIRVRDAMRAESLATGNYVFGVDVFRRATTQFLPTLSGPVPPDYRIGPGDHLVLIVTGDIEFAHSLQVTREGFLVIPQVGEVHVANLTLDELRELLYTRLGKVYSGIRHGPTATTHFDISIASVGVNQVYVIGEVNQPGAYQISALGTVLTALYAAGGLTNRANLRDVEVRRTDKTKVTTDLYGYLLHGDKEQDIRLETGDVVFVPLHGTRAQVTGAVVRPAIYELKPGETLVDLVRDAGGFRPDASLRRLAIHRVLPVSAQGPGPFPRTVIDVTLPKLAPDDPPPAASGAGAFNGVLVPALALADGDSTVVDSLPPLEGTLYVTIAGMIMKPGRYPWREGLTLRDLVLLGRGPKVGAYLHEAEVARLPEDRSHGQLAQTVRVPLDSTYLFERDSAGHYIGAKGLAFPAPGAPEVPLEPYDNVLILRQPNFELQRTVYIAGEVRFPGTYALSSKNERLSDLVARAGGLTAAAYPEGIRFMRALNHVGRIDIELARALKDSASRENIILQPDDSVLIPEYQPSVKVSGAVNSPGSVLWEKGEGLDYYLSAAGGASYKGDDGRVSVAYANGEVRTRHKKMIFWSSDPAPGPGSEVFVPVKDTTGTHTNWLALTMALAQVVTSAIAIVVLVKQL